MAETLIDSQDIIDYLKGLLAQLESPKVENYFMAKNKEVRLQYLDHVFGIEMLVEKLTLDRLKDIQAELNEKGPQLLEMSKELDAELERLKSTRKILVRLDKIMGLASRFAVLLL